MLNLPRLAAAALLAANLLTACGVQASAPPEAVPDDTFAVRLICKSRDVYRIYYSCYLDGAYCGMGGVADLDGKALTEEAPMTLYFPKSYFDGAEDISSFSIRRQITRGSTPRIILRSDREAGNHLCSRSPPEQRRRGTRRWVPRRKNRSGAIKMEPLLFYHPRFHHQPFARAA